MSSAQPTLSIVVLSWNTAELTCNCLRSLMKHHGKYPLEIIVIDNNSQDDSTDRISSEFPTYAHANNQGVKLATGEWLCLLNSDTEVLPGALDTLIDFLQDNKDYIIASPKLLNFDGTIQKACKRFPKISDPIFHTTLLRATSLGKKAMKRTAMDNFSHNQGADVDQPPGTCLAMATRDFIKLEGLDEKLSLYFNDVDFCLRAMDTGKKIRFIPEASIYHHEGASTAKYKTLTIGNPLFFANRQYYYKKQHGNLGNLLCALSFNLFIAEVFFRILLGNKNLNEKKSAIKNLIAEVKLVSYRYKNPGYYIIFIVL